MSPMQTHDCARGLTLAWLLVLPAFPGSTRLIAPGWAAGTPVFGVGGTRGLVISVIAVLALANFVNRQQSPLWAVPSHCPSSSSPRSRPYRLRAETGSRASVLITGTLLTVVVLSCSPSRRYELSP
jgi:hypothetical protein